MMKKLFATVGVVTLAFGGPAAAFTIDFTSSQFNKGGANPFTETVSGLAVTVSATPVGDAISFNAGDAPTGASFCAPTGNLACAGDGLGVTAPGSSDDEVTGDGAESITVTFGKEVGITGFTFLDAFVNPGNSSEFEIATIDFLGTTASSQTFNATESFTNGGFGLLDVVLASTVNATGFTLTVAGMPANDGQGKPDLALAAVSIIPLPAPVLLLGAALAGFGVAGWRRRQAA